MKSPSPVTRWILGIAIALVVLLSYFVLMDRYTPLTADAYVQAHVVQIAPRVAGRVSKVYVSDDARVEAGAPLFEIDPQPYAFRVNQLEAELALARQQVAQYRTELDAARAAVMQAQADKLFAEQQYGEVTRLAKKDFASRQRLEEVTDHRSEKASALRAAQAGVETAEARLAARVGDQHALLRAKTAELDAARYDLTNTVVSAPVAGYVTNQQLVTGAYMDAGQAAMTLIDDSRWWVVANFRENSLEHIRPDMSARLGLGLYPGRVFTARVADVGWGVSSGQGVPSGDLPDVEDPQYWVRLAQRFPVRVVLADGHRDGPRLRVGASATVLVYATENPVLGALASLWLRIGAILDFLY